MKVLGTLTKLSKVMRVLCRLQTVAKTLVKVLRLLWRLSTLVELLAKLWMVTRPLREITCVSEQTV